MSPGTRAACGTRLLSRRDYPQPAAAIVRLSAHRIDAEPHNRLFPPAPPEAPRWREFGFAPQAVSRGPVADSNQRGLVDAGFLAQLPRGACLVNLARGAHVVDDELLAALDRGHLAHAVLDVFHVEPLAPSHRFWHHPGVTVLPHVAALSDRRSAAEVVADNLGRLARGEPLRHRVERLLGY